MKVNAKRCSFGLKFIPFLGFIITWERVKTYINIVQGIRDLVILSNMTEA